MNKILFMVSVSMAALLIASCSSSRESTEGTGELKGPPKPLTNQFKMLSISAQHGLKNDRDVKKFADWIKTTGAELIAVQQIERATDSKPGFDAHSELLKKLDMRGTFAKARYYQGWDSGNSLFCIYPILQSNVYPLPAGKGKARRSLSFGLFELGLKPVAFGSTDLDDEDLSERVKQVNEIFSIQKSVAEYPMIVAGNFGESIKGKASVRMMDNYLCANNLTEQTSGLEQHVYLPMNGKMKAVTSEKIKYNELNSTGILVTVEVTQ